MPYFRAYSTTRAGRARRGSAMSRYGRSSAASKIQSAFRSKKAAARVVARAPPVARAKAVRSIKRASASNFNRKVAKVINRRAETFYQYGRALYAQPNTATNFQSASYHLFNLTGSAPLDFETMTPQFLLGLTPEAYAAVPPTSTQGDYRGASVFGKRTFSSMKINMPLISPQEISPLGEPNQSQYWAQNWNIRVLIVKSKPFPSTSVVAGGQMLKPAFNLFKSYNNSNFGCQTPTADAPIDSITGSNLWTADDLQWSKLNTTNYTKLLEKRFKLSLPEFIGFDVIRQTPTAPETTPYVSMGGAKKYPSERTIHFTQKINKKLQYNIEDELPPDIKSFPLNHNNTTIVFISASPVGDETNVQAQQMNAFIASQIKLSVQSQFSYTDM